MKPENTRKKSKGIEAAEPQAEEAGKAPLKLLAWSEETAVVSEPQPEPPRFIERSSDVAHWGINE